MKGLRLLGARMRAEENAPAALEQRLRTAHRKQHGATRWWPAAAAAVLLLAGGWLASHPVDEAMPEVAFAPSEPPRHAWTPRRYPVPAPRPESVTEFYMIPGQVWEEADSVRLVRVEMASDSLQLYGLPVSGRDAGHLIRADLVVADGVPRAIRFVK
ncbi:MAG: hypothetical protein IPM24_13535 [Bryobacterales bacterium]|nr:hypothetical protein [Bryobacterales bacterium]